MFLAVSIAFLELMGVCVLFLRLPRKTLPFFGS